MINTKKRIANLLRRMHLLQFVDTLMLVKNAYKDRRSNILFKKNHPDFAIPPIDLAYDAYNHTNSHLYYEMGLSHSQLITDLLREYIQHREIKICEWGCGPARVIRHLEEIEGFSRIELYGTDFNKKSIKWCKGNMRNIQFSNNELEPPLPYEAEMFDCVYAISIFTHLSEKMHHAWIKELFRTIKPNGILILTTQGDFFAKGLSGTEKERYEAGLFVAKDRIKEGRKHFAAYHPVKFMKEVFLKDYTILKHMPNPTVSHLKQEVWVVKK